MLFRSNGVVPNQVGDCGFWFLVRGGDDAFPYVALVNEQARLLIGATGEGDQVDIGFGETIDLAALRARLRE